MKFLRQMPSVPGMYITYWHANLVINMKGCRQMIFLLPIELWHRMFSPVSPNPSLLTSDLSLCITLDTLKWPITSHFHCWMCDLHFGKIHTLHFHPMHYVRNNLNRYLWRSSFMSGDKISAGLCSCTSPENHSCKKKTKEYTVCCPF